MSLCRRGKRGLFWHEFEFGAARYRASTGTKHRRSAERIEADARAKIALGVRDIGTHAPRAFSAAAGEFRKLTMMALDAVEAEAKARPPACALSATRGAPWRVWEPIARASEGGCLPFELSSPGSTVGARSLRPL
ncbi:MAG: hypothetical protein AB1714_07300 [Acidobacteriota bacterium]